MRSLKGCHMIRTANAAYRFIGNAATTQVSPFQGVSRDDPVRREALDNPVGLCHTVVAADAIPPLRFRQGEDKP